MSLPSTVQIYSVLDSVLLTVGGDVMSQPLFPSSFVDFELVVGVEDIYSSFSSSFASFEVDPSTFSGFVVVKDGISRFRT